MIGKISEKDKFTTLVVDDEQDLADIAAELLALHGMETVVVYSAQQALEIMELRNDIDAIFSDVMMPTMTGFEFAGIAAKNYPMIKIVLTSGFVALDRWNQTAHHYEFVNKPYSIDAVIEKLRR